ncbi:MAG: pirin family protein [Chitinophagaceae bacterium]|nr:pirin family protein [Chitinophagaceae bacterium]
MNYKKIKQVRTAAPPHMVGDGFKVRNFIGQDLWHDMSPFLMLDYNEPWTVGPTDHPRGVDVHPHKGFETVTIAWSGNVAHEDSSGGRGEIGPGDVQWMTAGSGILHKEFHAESFSRQGGVFHMAQLWVNLPAKFKNTPPSYQDLRDADMGRVQLPDNGGELRVIAGEQMGAKGPAKTFTRINIYDVKLKAGSVLNLELPDGDNTAIVVMEGNLMINNEQQARTGQMVVLGRTGTNVQVESNNEAHILVLSGEPIAEPISAYGPFVMNTKQEILEAIDDFNAGKFGVLN